MPGKTFFTGQGGEGGGRGGGRAKIPREKMNSWSLGDKIVARLDGDFVKKQGEIKSPS